MRLTQSQIEQYRTEGYLLVKNGLEMADLTPVIQEYEEHIDRRARELFASGALSQLYANEPFERRLASLCRENGELYNGLDIFLLRGKASFAFLRNDNLLDLVECIVGPEVTCSPIQHIRPKLPSGLTPAGADPHVVPWHQDAGVTWAEADPFDILTVWLPFTEARQENGCLQVLPGGHRNGLRRHVLQRGVGTTIVKDEMPAGKAVTLPMQPGDVLLLHKQTPHRSTRNVTDTVRWSADLRYQKTGTPTGRPFFPDFVVRSRANPGSVLTDHAQWDRQWAEALAEKGEAKAHRWASAG